MTEQPQPTNIRMTILGHGDGEEIIKNMDDLRDVLELQGLVVHMITLEGNND